MKTDHLFAVSYNIKITIVNTLYPTSIRLKLLLLYTYVCIKKIIHLSSSVFCSKHIPKHVCFTIHMAICRFLSTTFIYMIAHSQVLLVSPHFKLNQDMFVIFFGFMFCFSWKMLTFYYLLLLFLLLLIYALAL